MEKHCIVIGAGIVGASCAWHLRRRGLRVTLIDRELPGQSCSYGNASCIAASSVAPYSYPGLIRKVPGWLLDPEGPIRIRPLDLPGLLPWFWKFWRAGNRGKMERIAAAQARLMHRVFADYDEIVRATGSGDLYHARGSIHFFDNERDYRAGCWQFELEDRLGFTWRRLEPAEVASMAPSLMLGAGVAVFVPDWHHLADPARLTARIAENCFADGGEWLQDSVTQVAADGRSAGVRTQGGQRIEADCLVVAAGAWSNQIARQLDYEVPLVAERGYHSMIADPGVELEYPLKSMSRNFVMTPLADGLRLAGTAEFAALDRPPDYRRARVLCKQARRYLRGLRTEGASEWMGQRPAMPDSLPVISASPACPNVFYAFGHGHYGLTQGPTTGRLIAGLVSNEPAPIDLSGYRFDRFRRP